MDKVQPIEWEPPLDQWPDAALVGNLKLILGELTKTINTMVVAIQRIQGTADGQAQEIARKQKETGDG